MARSVTADKGFTLLELIIAIVLVTVVLLSAANLLISFGNFSTRVVRSEASLIGTALGSFEEIVQQITAANRVVIPGGQTPADSRINIFMDTLRPDPTGAAPLGIFTPWDSTDDTIFSYWLELVTAATATEPAVYNLRRTGFPGDPPGGTILSNDIQSLRFTQEAELNRITVTLDAQTDRGTTDGGAREHLMTTVTMRSRSAN